MGNVRNALEDPMSRISKIVGLFLIVLFMAVSVGCTEKQRARQWGGSSTVTLNAGQKLVVATWKETDLWLLTRPMREGEVAETYQFSEDSSWGVMEGSVTIVERR